MKKFEFEFKKGGFHPPYKPYKASFPHFPLFF